MPSDTVRNGTLQGLTGIAYCVRRHTLLRREALLTVLSGIVNGTDRHVLLSCLQCPTCPVGAPLIPYLSPLIKRGGEYVWRGCFGMDEVELLPYGARGTADN